jgi:hypothetical protein
MKRTTLLRQAWWPAAVTIAFLASGTLLSAYLFRADGTAARPAGGPLQPNESSAMVNRSELDEAFQRMLQCLNDNDIAYRVSGWNGELPVPMWEYTVGPFDSPDSVGSRTYDACWASFLRPTQARWATQHAPTEAERSAFEGAAVDCAQRAGIEVETYYDLGMLLRDPDPELAGDINRCFFTAEERIR